MSTHSDDEWGTAQSAQCGPHSGEAAASGTQRAGRAGAREDSPESAQSRPDSADDVKVTLGDYVAEGGAWIRSTFTPPDVWSTDRAALKKVWAYASRGEWTTDAGLFRVAGQVYALVVAVPVIYIAAAAEWTVERFSRLATVALLLWLLSQVPPLSWLI